MIITKHHQTLSQLSLSLQLSSRSRCILRCCSYVVVLVVVMVLLVTPIGEGTQPEHNCFMITVCNISPLSSYINSCVWVSFVPSRRCSTKLMTWSREYGSVSVVRRCVWLFDHLCFFRLICICKLMCRLRFLFILSLFHSHIQLWCCPSSGSGSG